MLQIDSAPEMTEMLPACGQIWGWVKTCPGPSCRLTSELGQAGCIGFDAQPYHCAL